MTLLLLSLALAADGPDAGGVALADLMAGLPACDAVPTAEPLLDLDRGCVDGLCVGERLPAFEAVYGPAECSESRIDGGPVCRFGDHLSVHLDTDSDRSHAVFLLADHQARTADGLGIGSPLTCFVDRYGDQASGVDVKVRDGRLYWQYLQFSEPRIIVSVDPEGRAKRIQLASRGRHRLRERP